MGFSATGRWLPGPPPFHNPEVSVTVLKKTNFVDIRGTISVSYRLGRIPVVSTVTGLSQALVGAVHAIIHLACFVLKKDREHNLKEMSLGIKHIGIGLSAAVPLIGNLFMFIFCIVKTRDSERIVTNKIRKDSKSYPEGEYSI